MEDGEDHVRGAGRPPYSPTDEERRMVERMSSIGTPASSIAAVLRISVPTLNKYYEYELTTSKVIAIDKVAQSLYNKAMSEESYSVPAAIFWLKTQARWKEPSQHVEHTGADGGPIVQANVKLDLNTLDQSERDALRAILVRRSDEPEGGAA